jgi:selenocysteine lyase/cysteine desulfurase
MNAAPYPDVEALRELFPVTSHAAYLNHAAVATLSEPVRQAIETYLRDRALSGDSERYEHLADELRSALAQLTNSTASEIAFVQNTSEGLNIAAQALPLEPGDNVLFCDMEFPSNVYPWMNLSDRGIEARCIPHRDGGLTVEALEAHADDRTRVAAVSSVEFLTGFRCDLAALGAWCRAHDCYFVVDGIQSLGVLPMDVQAYQIDVLSCGGPKWLMGPAGQGFIYVRGDLLEKLRPPFAGCISVIGWEAWRDYDLTPRSDARRFELGCGNLAGQVGLLAAVRLLLTVGVESIEAWALHLTDLLIEDLQQRGYDVVSNQAPKHRSAIVSFGADGGVERLYDRLIEAKVIVSQREDFIRVSPHCFNTEDEVLRVGHAIGNASA